MHAKFHTHGMQQLESVRCHIVPAAGALSVSRTPPSCGHFGLACGVVIQRFHHNTKSEYALLVGMAMVVNKKALANRFKTHCCPS